ncbi:MAG TPA: phosphoribosylanthranilate isomerase [Nitrospiraceae bacterium]|nr:MAG: N-(5'-phosphoribosyl)anthranilate isomerase [Nitrospirae bacterium GWA2_42_11]OGW58351.1 MAG: N-(5'-phosphoribosyl)anthranilate isomerase [Nitrospirae bacterium RIFCSPHIGHO2_02_FULL_42_12]HAS16831.1 phosphoribosylanthranilate isomerase [Nitrospiraceae bacterium]HBI22666.1 phosphoribosylanthranilate isomerase [Nitrospiraceae bacterium]
MVKVKICGITNLEDAIVAAEAGADALGFVFYPESPRYIEPGKVHDIISKLPVFITAVGVFVDESEDMIRRIMRESGVQIIQLHGSESPLLCTRFREKVIKAIRIKGKDSLNSMSMYPVNTFLLDTFTEDKKGGTGIPFDWGIAVKAKDHGSIILSGGLNPSNVREAVKNVLPYGVDVSSGVELSPGKKDHKKIRGFIKEVKKQNVA